jgi:exodeoxyribonuclease-5
LFTGGEENLSWADLAKTQQFTYGYALTCHKAQGSQWDDVVVFDESYCFGEDRNRWLYTALTRAANRVIVAI